MLSDAPRRIHLYRTQNQLGDLLLNVPAFRAIRERYPTAHLILVVGRQNAPAVLGQPWADEVRVVDTRNFLGAFAGSLAPEPRSDIAIYFTTVSYSVTGAFLVRRSRAHERLGFDPIQYRERDHARLTRSVPYPAGPLHQSEVNLVLARAAGAGAGAPPPPPYFLPDPALVSRAPQGVAYLHPGAGKIKNRWPAERFAEVAQALIAAGREVALIEGPQDRGTSEAVIARVGRSLPVVRGEPIAMLAARFARAAVYLGNDTGPLHLAGAVGCPTVGIYGWSDPDEWRPLGRCVRTLRAPDAKLESIRAARVLDTISELLERAA